MSPIASVVVITCNEAERLRLTLTALRHQRAVDAGYEVVVVDDGSSDTTEAVTSEAARESELTIVRHPSSRGRSAARNAGAASARGELLIFLDGDVLTNPEFVAAHVRAWRREPKVALRGEQFHLRCTRFFKDPASGTPMPGQEERVARMGSTLAASLVTAQQVAHDFESISRRAEPSIYPGAGPRRLYELEMRSLVESPSLRVLWMAASGHNFSIPRAIFEELGGYDSRLSLNEHRELTLRLFEAGGSIRLAPDAKSYHLTHRVGWRDPLEDHEWETIFRERHPNAPLDLMRMFWTTIAANGKDVAGGPRISSLEEIERALA